MYLLDINTLIALAWDNHSQHQSAHHWFSKIGNKGFATCHMTQSGFLRLCLNPNVVKASITAHAAIAKLNSFTSNPKHQFWEDGPVDTNPIFWNSINNSNEVPDANLFLISRRWNGKLATFDLGIQKKLPHVERQWVEIIG